jgi:hypothetical protein
MTLDLPSRPCQAVERGGVHRVWGCSDGRIVDRSTCCIGGKDHRVDRFPDHSAIAQVAGTDYSSSGIGCHDDRTVGGCKPPCVPGRDLATIARSRPGIGVRPSWPRCGSQRASGAVQLFRLARCLQGTRLETSGGVPGVAGGTWCSSGEPSDLVGGVWTCCPWDDRTRRCLGDVGTCVWHVGADAWRSSRDRLAVVSRLHFATRSA